MAATLLAARSWLAPGPLVAQETDKNHAETWGNLSDREKSIYILGFYQGLGVAWFEQGGKEEASESLNGLTEASGTNRVGALVLEVDDLYSTPRYWCVKWGFITDMGLRKLAGGRLQKVAEKILTDYAESCANPEPTE